LVEWRVAERWKRRAGKGRGHWLARGHKVTISDEGREFRSSGPAVALAASKAIPAQPSLRQFFCSAGDRSSVPACDPRVHGAAQIKAAEGARKDLALSVASTVGHCHCRDQRYLNHRRTSAIVCDIYLLFISG
jgi:hypothetical protein